MSIRIPSWAPPLALVVALPAWSQSADGVGAMYRCPGNDYNNTITAAEAEKLRCKKVENASVTVIQSASHRRVGRIGRAARAAGGCHRRSDVAGRLGGAARARQQRPPQPRRPLKSEEGKLSALEKEFNGGEPERRIDEFDFQKYLDRVARMRSAISRKQIEIAELRREIDKLPTPLSEPGGAPRAAPLDVQPGEDADRDADRAQRVDADLQPAALRQQRDRRHRDRDLQRRRRLRPAVMLVDLLVAALAPVRRTRCSNFSASFLIASFSCL